jgi:signal transduction histidine kinase
VIWSCPQQIETVHKRLIILSSIIVLAIGTLAMLGYHSISIWADGLEGARLAQFAEVAEQIRLDVKRKLDEFMQQEQNRPYTDYQYYSVPDVSGNAQQQVSLVVSPLAGKIENNLAFGNFEIEPDGSIITPYYPADRPQAQSELTEQTQALIDNIRNYLLPKLTPEAIASNEAWRRLIPASSTDEEALKAKKPVSEDTKDQLAKTMKSRQAKLEIESLQSQKQQTQVIEQQREVASSNIAYRTQTVAERVRARGSASQQTGAGYEIKENKALQPFEPNAIQPGEPALAGGDRTETDLFATGRPAESEQPGPRQTGVQLAAADFGNVKQPADIVQVRIEPFVPVVVPQGGKDSVFGGQVFLLRHVQIANQHLLQGFQLNEKRLIEEINDSARRFIREGMDFCLDKTSRANTAYSAILDFGFGAVTLNLIETDPGWIIAQIGRLRLWYFSIVAVVFLAVLLVIFSLWRAMRAQVRLSEQKDDFISAVSHELRTPLTSIRMYAEMLEKDWVKSQDKAREYYKGMRQESERLSRLIENVLDFSRIQKGRKKYSLVLGDLNNCVKNVAEVMRSYAAEVRFTIQLDLADIEPVAFDADAVTQIVVNLLDNAVKYARDAEDKTVKVRTFRDGRFVIIEVEDHGPGIPHKQRDKVFDVFYRCEAGSTRQTKGTGLGLALVSKFAQAHNGFVQILTAKPHGAIFRVGLAVQP